ncbi:acyltransferase [Escherichia coli]|uniref:acyltransferase family protein n=2 Tax=Escherichia coli TaxID=562 RepID=UPI00180C3506|nr:acyltransferase [Escherichia coli]EFC4251359.1 acyltransferase [Escherichia coli]EJZ1912361.1 acyltransferase [Escherichia coli]HAN5104800.1 acyltransferase [Escherichia coli]
MSFTTTDIFTILIFISFIIFSFLLERKIKLSPLNKNNDYSIEGLRGFACVFVFINHAAYGFNHIGVDTFNAMGNNLYFGKLGAFGVEIFFCITGFLFSKKIKNGDIDLSFFEKRIRRLVPAYIFTSTVVLLIFVFLNFNNIRWYYDYASLIKQIYGFGFFGSKIEVNGITDTSMNVVVWTLPYEWIFYAFVPFLAAAFKMRSYFLCIIFFGIALLSIDYWAKTFLWGYFISGFIASYIPTINNKIYKCISSILLVAIFLYIYKFVKELHGLEMLVCVSLFFFIFISIRPPLFSSKPLVSIGIMSYSIYLIHQVLISTSLRTISYFGIEIESMHSYIITVAVIALLTLVCSVLMYKNIERKFIT